MRVCLVGHGFPPASLGGTQIYTHDLARALHEEFGDDVFVLAREAVAERREYSVRRERRNGVDIAYVNNTFRLCRTFESTYRNYAVARIAGRLLDEFEPEIVHIQHLTCLSTGIVAECVQRRIPTIYTLNDYWLMCHRGQLLDVDHRRCDGPLADACARCAGPAAGVPAVLFRVAPLARGLEQRLPAAAGRVLRRVAAVAAPMTASDVLARREMARRVRHMRWLCGQVTCFLAPSWYLRTRFVEFGVDEHRILYQQQGIDQRPFRGVERTRGDRLRVGFLGSLMVSKAPHVLLEAFRALAPGRASLHLFGAPTAYHGDDRYRHQLAPLLALPGVHHQGAVPHEEVPHALASLDILVVPSVWVENAPFVIREAFAAGVPVVASNLGGMAEMVSHERNGLLFDVGDSADLRQTLERLLDEPGLLQRLRAGIPRQRSIEEDAAATREIYRAHLRDRASTPRRVRSTVSGPGAGTPRRMAAVVLNYGTPQDALLAVRSLEASRRDIDDIIVVDNGSADDSEEMLRAHLPGITVLQTGGNLGFSGGCNAGIREALSRGAHLVLLVNSDAIVPPDTVGRLEEAVGARADTGIAGPLIVSRSEPDQVTSAGMSFSPATGRMRHRGFGFAVGSADLPVSGVVDGVSGCVMLVKREVFERIGLLAEEYFFSFEDLDLCLRARELGFLTVFAGDAVVHHQGSLSIGARSARRLYFATRNHLLLVRRAAPLSNPLLSLARSVSILGFNIAHALLTTEAGRLAALGGVLRGAWHHARGRYGDGS